MVRHDLRCKSASVLEETTIPPEGPDPIFPVPPGGPLPAIVEHLLELENHAFSETGDDAHPVLVLRMRSSISTSAQVSWSTLTPVDPKVGSVNRQSGREAFLEWGNYPDVLLEFASIERLPALGKKVSEDIIFRY